MMCNRFIRCLLLFFGITLTYLSYYVFKYPEKSGAALENFLGPVARKITLFGMDTLFYCSGAGIFLFLFATVLFAAAFYWRGTEQSFQEENPLEKPTGSLQAVRYWLTVSSIACCVFTGAGLYLFAYQKNNLSVWMWLCMLISGAGIFGLLDAKDGVRFRFWNLSKKEIWLLVMIVGLFLVWIGHDVGHWRWAGTPDESHFYKFAENIAEKGLENKFLLSEDGVFGYHPVASSAFQALVMRLLGTDVWGWKLSSVIALCIALPFFHVFIKELFDTRTALASVVILGSTRLTYTFAHHGYNNIQVVPVTCMGIALMVRAIRQKSCLGWYLGGVISGVGFYTYYPARLTLLYVLMMPVLMLGVKQCCRKKKLWLAVILGVGLAVSPLLMNARQMTANMLQQTKVTGGSKLQTTQIQSAVEKFIYSTENLKAIMEAWFLAMIYGVWYKYPSHFNINPLMDQISAVFQYTGFWIAWIGIIKEKKYRLILLMFLAGSLIAGGISPYDRPPVTRLLFLTPAGAALAAIAISHAMNNLKCFPGKFFRPLVIWVAILGSVVWSYGEIWYAINRKWNGYGMGTTSEFIRKARDLPVNWKLVYIQRKDTYMDCLDLVADQFGLSGRLKYLRPYNQTVIQYIQTLEPPCAIFSDLEKQSDILSLEKVVRERFPEVKSGMTAPGRDWNLKFYHVP